MAHDPNFEDEQLSLPAAEPRARSRHMLLAGVAGACVLGVGAGLWARPAESERRTTAPAVAKVAEAPRPTGRLEIVVDDSPAPIGAPIEVLPAMTGEAADADAIEPAPAPDAEPLAPVRAPSGLVRVQSVEPMAVEAAPAAPPIPKAAPKPEVKKADPKKLDTRQADAAKAKAKLAEARVAEAKAKKAEKAKRDEKALAERARKDAQLAKAEAKAEAARQAKAEAKAKDAAKAKALAKGKDKAKLAKAKAAKPAQVAEAKKPNRLSKLLAKVTHHAKPAEPPRKVAKAEPKPKKLKTEKAVLKRAPAPVAPKPAKIKRDSSFRLASNRCVSADPGEALVCADAGLGAADRQLNRAYRQAEAAGVSTATLARQQARWLSARAQAAREAPWAVRDVYEARIAELNDQTRDARREY